MRAEIARPDELDLGMLDGDVVAHRALGQQHHPGRPLLPDKIGHRRGRAGEVAFGDDIGWAFGMRQHKRPRITHLQLNDFLFGKNGVHNA